MKLRGTKVTKVLDKVLTIANSVAIQKTLIGFYVLLTLVTLYENNHGKTVYWIGAIILSIGVLMMK